MTLDLGFAFACLVVSVFPLIVSFLVGACLTDAITATKKTARALKNRVTTRRSKGRCS